MTRAPNGTRRAPGRIIFLCPDVTTPFGGIKVIYQMVDALVAVGFDAYVWHADANARMSWFSHQTPVLGTPMLKLEKPDVLVVPEMLGPNYARTAHAANVVILNQGHFQIFRGAGLRDEWPGKYPAWPNAVAVVTTSEAIKDFVDFVVEDDIPVFPVSLWIDSEVFTPGEKLRRIVVPTRRRHADVETIIQLLHRSSRIHDWEVRPVDGLTQQEFADLLGTSRIFVSLSDREGLGLPPAEATASGCYAVGFTGDGGREFMLPNFCSPIDDPNLIAVVKEVERVAESWSTDPSVMSRMAHSSREFVLTHFRYERFRDSLVSAFEELARPGSAALQETELYLQHYSAISAPSTLLKLASRMSPRFPMRVRRLWRRKNDLAEK